jgi:hypothetical protein
MVVDQDLRRFLIPYRFCRFFCQFILACILTELHLLLDYLLAVVVVLKVMYNPLFFFNLMDAFTRFASLHLGLLLLSFGPAL